MTDWTPTLAPGGRARYQQIADAIEADLRGGRLKPGDRLPPQRKLAERLASTLPPSAAPMPRRMPAS